MVEDSTVVLEIEEQAGRPEYNTRLAAPCGSRQEVRQRWHFQLTFQGLQQDHVLRHRRFEDPFLRTDHKQCSKFLTQKLDDTTTKHFTSRVDIYRKRLLLSLKLDQIATQLQNQRLEIRVRSKNEDDSGSFHDIQWEQLEGLESWQKHLKITIRSVTVVRVLRSSISMALVPPKPSNVFEILLVVARKHIFEMEYDIPRPATIQSLVLKVQESLKKHRCLHDINLEVVRPGSLDELKEHFGRRKKAGLRSYDAVHFDMHGVVSQKSGSQLIFNAYDMNGQLQEDPVPACEVAKILADNHVKCAILNGCKTAYSISGMSANLSWIFLNHGISNVLAMSYDILDSTAENFYSCFYHEFIINRKCLHQSAAIARQYLRENLDRHDYESQASTQVQDWFVPTIFSDGTNMQVGCANHLYHKVYDWLHRPVPLRLRFRTSHLCCFLTYFLLVLLSRLLDWTSNLLTLGGCYMGLLLNSCCFVGPFWLIAYRSQNNKRKDKKFLSDMGKHNNDHKNMLRMEGILKYNANHRRMFFYSPIMTNARPLLHFVTDIWKRTSFIEERIVIQADWFIQRWDFEGDNVEERSLPEVVQLWTQTLHNILMLYSFDIVRKLSTLRGSSDIIVVVENFNILGASFQDRKTFQDEAQTRFELWLRKHFSPQPHIPRPYLVLIGNAPARISNDWFQSRYPQLRTLESIKMLSYLPPALMLTHKIETELQNGDPFEHLSNWSNSRFRVQRPIQRFGDEGEISAGDLDLNAIANDAVDRPRIYPRYIDKILAAPALGHQW